MSVALEIKAGRVGDHLLQQWTRGMDVGFSAFLSWGEEKSWSFEHSESQAVIPTGTSELGVTVRMVRKSKVTARPQDILSPCSPLYRHFTSQQRVPEDACTTDGRARFCKVLHPLSPADPSNASPLHGTLLGHHHLYREDCRRAPALPLTVGILGAARQCRMHRAPYPPLAKPMVGSLSPARLSATCAPSRFLRSRAGADHQFPEGKKESESSITSDLQSSNCLASSAGQGLHICPPYTKCYICNIKKLSREKN